MHGDDGSTFFSRVEHLLKEEAVVLGMQHQQLFVPWSQSSDFFRLVDRCIKTICDHDESSLPGYIISVKVRKSGILAMQYLVPIRYETLGEQEYLAKLERALSQSAKVMSLLFLVCDAVVQKKGVLTESECMQALYQGLAAVTVMPSADLATGTRH